MKIILYIDEDTDEKGVTAILDEIKDKMEDDYPEIVEYAVEA